MNTTISPIDSIVVTTTVEQQADKNNPRPTRCRSIERSAELCTKPGKARQRTTEYRRAYHLQQKLLILLLPRRDGLILQGQLI